MYEERQRFDKHHHVNIKGVSALCLFVTVIVVVDILLNWLITRTKHHFDLSSRIRAVH